VHGTPNRTGASSPPRRSGREAPPATPSSRAARCASTGSPCPSPVRDGSTSPSRRCRETVATQLVLLRLKAGAKLEGLDEKEWRKRFDDWCFDPRPEKDLSPLETVGHYHPYYHRVERLPACLCVNVNRAGDYFLAIRDGRSWDGEALDNQSGLGPYRLWVEFSGVTDPNEPNDSAEQARPIAWDRPAPVTLFPDGDRDHFTFSVERPAQLSILLADVPEALVPIAELLDAKGAKVPLPDAGNMKPAVLSAHLLPGQYRLLLRDSSGRSSKDAFTLLLHREEIDAEPGEPNDTVEAATPLAPGRDLRAAIYPVNDVDLYSVEPDGPGRIQFLLADLPGVPTSVRLLDSDGKTVLVDQAAYVPAEGLAGRCTAIGWRRRDIAATTCRSAARIRGIGVSPCGRTASGSNSLRSSSPRHTTSRNRRRRLPTAGSWRSSSSRARRRTSTRSS